MTTPAQIDRAALEALITKWKRDGSVPTSGQRGASIAQVFRDLAADLDAILRAAPAGEQMTPKELAERIQAGENWQLAPPAEEPVADGLSASERWFVIEGFIAGYCEAGGIPLRNQRVSDIARDWLQDSVADAVTVEMALASQAALYAHPHASREEPVAAAFDTYRRPFRIVDDGHEEQVFIEDADGKTVETDDVLALLNAHPPAPRGVTAECIERVVLVGKEAVIAGDTDSEFHNCDAMGCPSLDHVLARVPFEDRRAWNELTLPDGFAERLAKEFRDAGGAVFGTDRMRAALEAALATGEKP